MAVSFSDPNNLIREWAPLTHLLNKLPTKIQSGLFSQDVKLTCIDILPEFIALGTNLGIVYWYDRKNRDIKHLHTENKIQISAVKIISTVDYMVACGNTNGTINIFQVPKTHPDSIPDCLKPKNKNVERYSVSELHKSAVTAIEWSKNGMKLFSGDKNGCIVLTEIDFYMHICKSREIINESYEVVQLSYSQQRLLVSTTYRSIVCRNCGKWEVCQVGRKDRKILGHFGGVIHQKGVKSSDTYLYCTRPGVRIWMATVDGAVQKTILFKDILSKECHEVPLINPISRNLKALKPHHREPSFGVLLPFNDNLLVTYSNDVLYILDSEAMTIIATVSHLRGILSVATYKDEIFILEGERSIIRISHKPETVYENISPLFATCNNTMSPITSTLKDLTNKIQTTTQIIPALPTNYFDDQPSNNVDIYTDSTLIMNAEEAKESPVKVQMQTFGNVDQERKKFDAIGQQEFGDTIVYKQYKHQRKKKGGMMSASTMSLSSTSSEEKDLSGCCYTTTKPTLMSLSSIGILPDLRSPESIQNDISYKEKILADVLNLDRIKLPSLDKLIIAADDNDGDDDDDSENVQILSKYVLNNVPVVVDEPLMYDIPVPVVNTVAIPVATPRVKSPAKDIIPACVNVPNDWKLIDIKQSDDTSRNDTLLSDNSLNDWEIL